MADQLSICRVLLKKALKKGIGQKVSGHSMHPAIRNDQSIKVKSVDPETLKVGDVIIFKSKYKDNNIVHRIVINQKEKKVFITKGDNRLDIDPPVEYDMLLGKAFCIDEQDITSTAWEEKNKTIAERSLQRYWLFRPIKLLLLRFKPLKDRVFKGKNLGLFSLVENISKRII